MRKGVFLLVFSLGFFAQNNLALAQGLSMRKVEPITKKGGEPIICYSRDENAQTSVPFRRNLEALAAARTKDTENAVFEVTYTGFTTAEQAAFQRAVDIWSSLLTSSVPIRIAVAMRSDMPSGTLASTGWGSLNGNFRNAQKINTYYVVAMAERMAGEDLNDPGDPDIIMSFNANRNFYTGLDAQPPLNTFDLVTIALHEIAHGLGFFTHTFVDDNGLGQFGSGLGGIPTVYARAMENSAQENIFDTYNASNPSTALGDQLTGEDLYFRGSSFASGGLPRLFAPGEWNSGSSIAHLDEDTYFEGSVNSLMTPQIDFSEAIHEPGIALKMLQDMGWINMDIAHNALLDSEDASAPRPVTAVIQGDNAVAANGVSLTYTYLNWTTATTVEMSPTGNANEYEASIPGPGSDAVVSYFIAVDDVAGRQYTLPGEAPEFFNQYVVAADTIDPILIHQPLSVVFLNDPVVDVYAIVGDNLGVGPLLMTYRIAGKVPETEIEIPLVSVDDDGYYLAEHRLAWDLGPLNIANGDVVEYKLKVVDASGNANEAIHPAADIGYNRIQVDQLNTPVSFYSNDFNQPTNDFVGSGFTIGNQTGFSSGIMHTDHPYRSAPGASPEDTLVLYYMLKTPIEISATTDNISFDEVVLVEPGEPGSSFGDDDFWDYVIVEASKDFGVTWEPLIDGYDAKDYSAWEAHYNSDLVLQNFNGSQFQDSEATGNETLWRARQLQLLDNPNLQPGDQVLIRFKLYADQLAAGWGWAIDNLKIQIDDEAPEITHIPTDYLTSGEDELKILTRVTDNGILDSVTFEVNINGNTQLIVVDEETDLYQLTLNLTPVDATTTIKYRIVAVDSAVVPNTAFLPATGFFEIPVVNLGDAKAIYSNDFKTITDDFIGASFRVIDYEGFSSKAIHSLHPHANAAQGTDTISYLLRYPILTNMDHAWMRFDEVVLVNYNNDGVLVEVSNDAGANWYPVVDPYSALEHQEWIMEFFNKDIDGNSTGEGAEALYRPRLVDLLSPAEISGGDEVLVRFSLIADDDLYSWGWAIDNLEIQDVTTGLDAEAAIDLEIFPNPAVQGKFRLRSNVNEGKVTLSIRDMSGKTIFMEELPAVGGIDNEFSLKDVRPGVYLVILESALGRSVERLVLR